MFGVGWKSVLDEFNTVTYQLSRYDLSIKPYTISLIKSLHFPKKIPRNFTVFDTMYGTMTTPSTDGLSLGIVFSCTTCTPLQQSDQRNMITLNHE